MEDEQIKLPYFEVVGVAESLDGTNWGIEKYLPQNHRRPQDGIGITVAVMDTGVFNHPELGNRIIESVNFGGDDFVAESSSHGTHVAATIAGETPGVGYAPYAEVIDLRVLGSNGSGALTNILDAGQWLLDNRNQFDKLFINCSFGYGGRNDAIEKMFRDFSLANIYINGAAGNTGTETLFYPGAFSNVLTVGAMTEQEGVANFSTSNDQLDIIAAGTNIYSAWGKDGYARLSGTSMACPAVTGMAVIKESRLFKPKTFIDHISLFRETATDIGTPGFNKDSGYGRMTPVAVLSKEVGDDETTYDNDKNSPVGAYIAIGILILVIIGLLTL